MIRVIISDAYIGLKHDTCKEDLEVDESKTEILIEYIEFSVTEGKPKLPEDESLRNELYSVFFFYLNNSLEESEISPEEDDVILKINPLSILD